MTALIDPSLFWMGVNGVDVCVTNLCSSLSSLRNLERESFQTYTREAAAIVFEIFRSITLQENTLHGQQDCRCFSSVCLLTKNNKPV